MSSRSRERGTYGTRQAWQEGDVPLQACLEEGDGEGAVVAIEHQVKRGEESERVLARRSNFIGDDPVPERVVRRRGEDVVARVRRQVEVVECELRRVPEEVENTGADRGGIREVGAGRAGVVLDRVQLRKESVCTV